MAVGFFKSALPQNIVSEITDNVFSPVNTMFLNALKMVVAPLVFFSIASSIADFGNIKALGRIAGKDRPHKIFQEILSRDALGIYLCIKQCGSSRLNGMLR
ncbi:MAG: cation:dicarboxylase symporter family transporter [Firmicutes bacterium]|nr:cation:dicarboxylase symporter family transporter [Bacillota bacterium]MBQ9603898.1 cation:dicarboxylase symporter family transporter [Bacillota bacterium]